MKKILLLGKSGQVGWELQRALCPVGEFIALDRHDTIYCGDLAQLNELKKTIQTIKPDIVVNAAAYTAVDQAEMDQKSAILINADAPALIAQTCNEINALFIHYSTDYVFNGLGNKPWSESDATEPVNQYGKSKLLGELAILESGCRHFIFRTSWVYAARGQNFIKTILRLARQHKTLHIISDQIGVPTGAELLADVTAQILIKYSKNNHEGIYHLCPQGETSWYTYATYILECAKDWDKTILNQGIQPISSAEYQTQAKRPLNSRLNTQKLEQTFTVTLPFWQTGVNRAIQEILG